jgi:lactoylglutathione lyase
MKYLHTMVRGPTSTPRCAGRDALGLKELAPGQPQGRFTLIFLAAPGDGRQVELTHNWDPQP